MTTVFVYEFCCALGLGREPSDPAHSLYREGRAMRDAVADDFRRVSGVQVEVMDRPGEDDHGHEVWRISERSDYTVVIAPEFGGLLDQVCGAVDCAAGRLLGPDPAARKLTGDKLALFDFWSNCQIPTPQTGPALSWPLWQVPVVFKPRLGAGSVATFAARHNGEPVRCLSAALAEYPGELIAQHLVPGRAASVAFLVGPNGTVPLLPTFQVLSTDGRFRYEGGELPIHPDLDARAVALGRRAIDCVPGLLGYVGVDLILGDAADGSQDYAIEINPRLTTSYVGLRRLADFNLAEAMLKVATGEPAGELRWKPGRVWFRPDGSFDYDPTPGAVFD